MMRSDVEMAMGTFRFSVKNKELISIEFIEGKMEFFDNDPTIERAVEQLSEYMNGERETFDLPLAPTGTDFQKKVWNELMNIPFGTTISYLELAKRLGDEKVIRAAASANGKNPIPIVIPCHRVIGSDGSLTGYAGGLDKKRWLLKHEGALVQPELF